MKISDGYRSGVKLITSEPMMESIEFNEAGVPGCAQGKDAPFFNHFFLFSKLLVVVLGLVSVEELVRVEDAHSAPFARYGRKINILTYLLF